MGARDQLGLRSRATAPAAVFTSLLAASTGHAQCRYELTILDYPVECGVGDRITIGLGLNDLDVVVGRYKCQLWKWDQAFVWTAELVSEADLAVLIGNWG